MTKQKIKQLVASNRRGNVFVAHVSPEQRLEMNLLTLRVAAAEDLPLVYIMAKYPYKRLKNGLSQIGVVTEENVFIDAISKTVAGAVDPESENLIYVSSPTNLTNIATSVSVAVDRIGGDVGVIALDSLEALLTYNTERSVANFLSDLRDRVATLGLNALLFFSGDREELTGQILEHVDDLVFLESDIPETATISIADADTAAINIPRYYLKALDWEKGDDLRVSIDDGSLTLTPSE